MGEILGLGVTHYPGLYALDGDMANLLRTTLSSASIPERLRNPANWPVEMQDEWGSDGGATAARKHRHRCFEAFLQVRQRIQRFEPDFVVIVGDDQYENFVEDIVPPFCLYILDEMQSRPFLPVEGEDEVRGNIWKERASTVFKHRGHPDGARFIANGLADEGVHIPYAYRLRSAKGLPHAFINTLMYLDADRKGFDFPIVPLHVNCYGGALVRSQGGRLPPTQISGQPDPRGPSAAACFDLGRAMARVLAKSPWRVALIASSSWSHAFLTAKNDWIFPDHTADRARLEELRGGHFSRWRELSWQQLEDAGQQELLNWVTVAGAMAELGRPAHIIDYVETHVLNSNKCFAYWQ